MHLPIFSMQASAGLAGESAAHIRQQLTQVVPLRLLLPSLLAYLDPAVLVSALHAFFC